MEALKKHIRYEVFGHVQGVFFRKYTKTQAQKLGLTGWVENTPRGTVIGEAEGPSDKIEEFKHWLRNIGSPKSRIDDLRITNETDISQLKFHSFSVKK
ncbi:unnamed protein product [Blepharisma stoltei]|uniref:acylphosphatase n=1 Tax=Blepharisma stoltei TaxID=1481888 RepID=A0AAU9K0X8_9CILI|nr:unnamed protein product [Blepharisma stoltei]